MKRSFVCTFLMAALALLSGCLFRPVDDLYRLPERFPEYESLEAEIVRVRDELKALNSNVEYATIYSGDNTAIIQLHDLDGDGVRESALTAFRVTGVDKPLKIYVFTQNEAGDYTVSGLVEGEGTAIYELTFANINGKGRSEIVVSWQISGGANQLGVYTLDDLVSRSQEEQSEETLNTWENPAFVASQLMLTGYTSYSLSDMNQNQLREVAVVKIDNAGSNSMVEVWGWKDGTMEVMGTVRLSDGIVTQPGIRIRYDRVAGGIPALYISSTLADGGKATDIITYYNGQFANINMDQETGVSRNVIRDYAADVEPTDINQDSILEIPTPKALTDPDGDGSSNFWLIEWSQYDAGGEERYIFTTYHNASDGWYLIIPEHWKDRLVIRRNDSVSGQRAVIFHMWSGAEGQSPVPFLYVYRLTGNSRTTRATLNTRFVLREEDTVIYAAAFDDAGWDCGLTESDLLTYHFNRIASNWSSR